jgi:hypothetical protein
MWRALQIVWRIIRGCVELAIVVYVLTAITDPDISLIVGVLGLIYVTIRTGFMYQAMMLLKLASELERQVYDLKRRLDQVQRRVEADTSIFDQEPQRPDTATAAMSRIEVAFSIEGVFITLVWLICLVHVLSIAAGHRLLEPGVINPLVVVQG